MTAPFASTFPKMLSQTIGPHHIGAWYANYICRYRRHVQRPDTGHWLQYFDHAARYIGK